MKLILSLIGAVGLLPVIATPSLAAKPETIHPGKQVFTRYCAECHAPGAGHPGTQQLGWTRGVKLAELEQRKDLVPEYIVYVVRHGLVEMPALRPTEISDADLKALAGYLSGEKPTN